MPHCGGHYFWCKHDKANMPVNTKSKWVGMARGGRQDSHRCMKCGRIIAGASGDELYSGIVGRSAPTAADECGLSHNEFVTSRDEVIEMNTYLLECLAFFEEVRTIVPGIDLADARSLLDHGEPAEGLSILAWVLAQQEVAITDEMAAKVRRLTAELIDPQDLPAQFRD